MTLNPAMQAHTPAGRPKLDEGMNFGTFILFLGILTAGLLFVAYSIYSDVEAAGTVQTSYLPYLLLGIALIIALGFEFVNGFHDTANAVATVIYTHSLPANFAVIWSGFFNFLGVATSTGAVAFGIVSLLPVELILQVGSDAGFAMVFALLIAAIIWNLGTWWLGLPASSSHTMIGSIIGVGIANALDHGRDGTSGVDWGQAISIGNALLLSPIFGFFLAAGLFWLLHALVKNVTLFSEPKSDAPPPWWIRGILILTCTGVSFFHGSNDGQKGMGLIMLILIGTVPTTYALNRAMPDTQVAAFVQTSDAAVAAMAPYIKDAMPTDGKVIRTTMTDYVRTKTAAPGTLGAFSALASDISKQIAQSGSLSKVPAGIVQNVRNDMYLESEAAKTLLKSNPAGFDDATKAKVSSLQKGFDASTKFIPFWVKIAVAVALGLGTMVGWKRIVVTVGEKIGKTHLTYAQGASAEIVAMACIGAADNLGLPVSTTHVLSSGIAGTMYANKSGLQFSTIRNIALGWILTLPVAMIMSGILYVIFSKLFHG